MFCPECGKKNPEEMKFCSQCGSQLIDNTQDNSSQGTLNNAEVAIEKTVKELKQKADVTVNKMKANPKKTLIIAGIIFVLFVTIGSVFSVITTPEHIAEQYFKGIVKGDWNKVYSMMSLEKSEFITKDGFVAVMESGESNYGKLNIANYEVKKNKGLNAGVSEIVIIEYINHDSQSPQSMQVHMIKQSGKKFLFFNDYKVSSNDLIASDYRIYALPFVKVSIDDIELTEKYVTKEENGITEYTIPQIFSGAHTIKIYGDKIEATEDIIEIHSGSSYTVSDVMLAESEFNALVEKSEKIFREMISSATSGKSFEELSVQFTADKNSLNQIKNYYDSICENTVAKKGHGLKTVTFKSFETRDDNREISNDGSIQCRLRYEYDTESIYKNYNDELEEQTSSYTRNSDLRIYFSYENGEYVVKSISGSIYY